MHQVAQKSTSTTLPLYCATDKGLPVTSVMLKSGNGTPGCKAACAFWSAACRSISAFWAAARRSISANRESIWAPILVAG